MSLDKMRDGLLILAALCFLAFYGQNLVEKNLIEKSQLAQKVQQLEKQLDEAKKDKEAKK